MNEDSVITLKDADDLGMVGGKALALGKLKRAGFNVPDGFVVTTKANQLMSAELKSEILDNFDKLNSPKVAVRSSAAAEDGKDAAWAGQFDTFLNTARKDLIENIKKCWVSTQSKRAQEYAKQKGLKSGSVGVIVQKMIDSQIAGVAFSIDPVFKNTKHIVIEAVKGLGEQLVSGNVTPDNYVVDKQSRKIVSQNLTGNSALLNNEQIKNLAEQVIKIEEFYSFPVDIEWTFTNDELFILQSRPITTL